jgi:hypothetical protein
MVRALLGEVAVMSACVHADELSLTLAEVEDEMNDPPDVYQLSHT